jgi:hypothetical protein
MGTHSAVHPGTFPAQLDEAEIQARGAFEAFTWGPQVLWLLCGLILLFYWDVRDVPEIAAHTGWVIAGVLAVAGLGLAYEMRRRRRRISLYPLHGQIGLYRNLKFQYSFAPEEMVRQRLDWTGWTMILLKVLLPMLVIIGLLGFGIFEMSKEGKYRVGDVVLMVYALLVMAFGFVAVVRSNMVLHFFWVPNGKGKRIQPVHLRREDVERVIGER